MNFKKLGTILIALGLAKAPYTMAAQPFCNPKSIRYLENMTARERQYIFNYLNELRKRGYQINLRDYTIVVDGCNQLHFVKKSKGLFKSLGPVEQPSCVNGEG